MSQLFASVGQSIEVSVLISFRMDWLNLLEVQGTLNSLLQHHSSKASIPWGSVFFTILLSHPYMTTGKTIALTRRTFVDKVMSLLFNILSKLVAGVQPQQDPGEPSGWTTSANERVRQSSGLSLKFIFAQPLYTLNNIFGGSAYCLHTGHLKTLQQLDLQQKQDVTHILFLSQESYHLAFRPANILLLAPGVT